MRIPRNAARGSRHHKQQERQRHEIGTLVEDAKFDVPAGIGATQCLRLLILLGLHLHRHLAPFLAGTFGCVEFVEAAAGHRIDARTDVVGAQEWQQFSCGYCEEEFRVGALTLRSEGIDPDHPAAFIYQRTATVPARDRSGVQQRVEFATGSAARQKPLRGHGRLRAENVVRAQALRLVDIHRIADRGHRAGPGRMVSRDGERRQSQRTGGDQQGKVVARADRYHPRIDRISAIRWDDSDRQTLVVQRLAHDVGVGHDMLATHSETGAVADGKHFLAIAPHHNNAHDPARGGFYIGRVGLRGLRRQKHERESDDRDEGAHRAPVGQAGF